MIFAAICGGMRAHQAAGVAVIVTNIELVDVGKALVVLPVLVILR